MMRCDVSSVALCAIYYTITLISVMTLLLSFLPLTTSTESRHVHPLPAKLLSTRILANKSHNEYPGTRLSRIVPLLGEDKPKLSLQNINHDKFELPLSTVLVNKWKDKDGGMSKLSKDELEEYSEGEERYKVKQNHISSSHTPLHASHAFSHSLHNNHTSLTPSHISLTPSQPALHASPQTSVAPTHSSTLPPTTSIPSVEATTSNASERRQANITKLTSQPPNNTMDHPYDITNLSSREDTRIEKETHFFWSWEAVLIVGLTGWWVVALSSLAFLFRSSLGIRLIQALCPSLLSLDDDDEEMTNEYIIFLDGSPGMRRPSADEIREREAGDYGLENDDIWPKERGTMKWIDTFSTLDHIKTRNHQVLEIARVNREHLWNERAVFPTTRASVIKKTEAFIPERVTREHFLGTSTYWRTQRIDIPFPHPVQSSSSDSVSFILELDPPAVPRLQRKLSLILEENMQA